MMPRRYLPDAWDQIPLHRAIIFPQRSINRKVVNDNKVSEEQILVSCSMLGGILILETGRKTGFKGK
jgi:hypothetical protein